MAIKKVSVIVPMHNVKTKITTLENQCFFAMPFSAEYTNLYDTLAFHLENNGYRNAYVLIIIYLPLFQ